MKLATCLKKIAEAIPASAIAVLASKLKPRTLIPVLAKVKDADDKRLTLIILKDHEQLGICSLDGKHLFYGLKNMIVAKLKEIPRVDEDTRLFLAVTSDIEKLEALNTKQLMQLAQTTAVDGRSKMKKAELITGILLNNKG